MSRNQMKLVSPLTIKKSQSKFKKRGFALFLIAGATTFAVNYYKTEVTLYHDKNPFNNQIVRNCRQLNKVSTRTNMLISSL